MRPLHRVLLFVAACAAFYGVEACSTETDPGAELNPQPLPPSAPGDQKTSSPEEARDPNDNGGSTSTGSSGGGSSSGAGASSGTVPGSDGGGDAGTDSGGDG